MWRSVRSEEEGEESMRKSTWRRDVRRSAECEE